MKSTVAAAAFAVAFAHIAGAAAATWSVDQAAVRVICPMTVGGSFDAKTTSLRGALTSGTRGVAGAFEGSLAVDLRTLDTGIDLRNSHLRENYLEVDKGPAFDSATLSEIDVKGFTEETTDARTTFAGSLTLHGVTRRITGAAEIRRAGDGLRVKASFAVVLADYGIAKPRFLGVGVKDVVQVEVDFGVGRRAG